MVDRATAIDVLLTLRAHYEQLAQQWALKSGSGLAFDEQHGIRCGFMWEVEALDLAIKHLRAVDDEAH